METSLHRFVRLLRLRGVRVSVAEAADAMRCASQPGVLSDRAVLRDALRVALVKDRRDDEVFDEVFAAFFALRPVVEQPASHGHDHAHDDLDDTGELETFTASEEPSETPQEGHSHDSPKDIRDYFDPKDLAQQYNLHQEANKIDLASLTDEIVFSQEQGATGDRGGADVQIETSRLHNAGAPGQLAHQTGHRVDTDLTIAEERLLLDWLTDTGEDPDDQQWAEPRGGLAGVLDNLPEMLRRHLRTLAELERAETGTVHPDGMVDRVDERERQELEDSLRRLAHSLRGARTSKHVNSPHGRVHPGRTMRRNMRYDAVPFRPVTTMKAEDKPRLVVLTDVSLSVRSTARFTLHLVHGLQSLFSQVRTFAFVAETVEITDLFEEHPLERALGLVFDGLPAGGVLDVDANSDYGSALRGFLGGHGNALNRRTTLIVLGDGRGNGNDPNIDGFAQMTRRVRETIWLTPEPRYSWGLGRCDLPLYAEYCDRVEVVRDLAGLARTSMTLASEVTGR
ncbi:VWA domain-containing protein [Allosalinactinospora lopnorensis]|uniref:VWA domain-containing protein n=1 Tax=Allosalinactinospora lopnorensis TaxID=1352348 RepID=UPI000623FF8F|nr:VWA domain-containing protein [Allosalinactinospora lopnorensis]